MITVTKHTSHLIQLKMSDCTELYPLSCFVTRTPECSTNKCSAYKFCFNTLRPRQNRRPPANDIFKCIFLNENEWISPRISLKFVRKVWINNIPALVAIMAWRRLGDKPLSETMMVNLLTHICVTRLQWGKVGIHPTMEHQWYEIGCYSVPDT